MDVKVENGRVVVTMGAETTTLEPATAWAIGTLMLQAVSQTQLADYIPPKQEPKGWKPQGTGVERL